MTRALATVAVLAAFTLASIAQTAFTYQGQLQDGGQPATGTYDLRATLYDAATGGTQLGEVARDDVAVDKGLFTVSLDFGVLTAGPRWLEIAVRRGNETGAYTPILPRQNLTPSPFAITAYRVAPSSVTSEGLAFDGGSLAKVSDGVMRLDGGAVVVQPSAGVTHLLRAQTGWYSPEAADQHAGYGSGAQYGLPTAIDPNEWQSFQPGVTGLLTAAQLRTAGTTTGTWTFTLEVREGEGATGALLASAAVTGGYLETVTTVAFAQPPLLQANTTYSLVFADVPAVNPRPKLNGWYDQYARGRSGRDATYDFAFDTAMQALNAATPLQVAGGSAWGVGVGAVPANGHRLDVAGSLRATGFTLPTGAGAGKVLTSNASGAGAWQALPAYPTTLPPSGAAGGDLTGTYPNPAIGAGKVTDAHIAAVDWSKVLNRPTIPTTLPPSGAAGGDLTGTYPNPGIGADKVTGTHIADGAVTAADLASDTGGLGKVSGGALAMSGGHPTVATANSLNFGSAYRQAINLYGTLYGQGVQTGTFYQRSNGGFAWYKGGVHGNTKNDPGAGGTRLMTLDTNGFLGLGAAAGASEYLLHVKGTMAGTWANPLTRIENLNTTTSSGPALNLAGTNTPDGVLNVSAYGTGKILALGSTAGGGEVAHVDVNGNLTLKGAVSAANIRPAPAVKHARHVQQGDTGREVSGGSHAVLDDITFTAPGPGKVLIVATAQVGGDASYTGNLAGYFNLDDATYGDPAALIDRVFIMAGYDHITLTVVVDAVTDRPMRVKTVVADYNDEKEKCFYWGHSLTATYIPNSM